MLFGLDQLGDGLSFSNLDHYQMVTGVSVGCGSGEVVRERLLGLWLSPVRSFGIWRFDHESGRSPEARGVLAGYVVLQKSAGDSQGGPPQCVLCDCSLNNPAVEGRHPGLRIEEGFTRVSSGSKLGRPVGFPTWAVTGCQRVGCLDEEEEEDASPSFES